jgi:MFS transporter, ACS family, hexuronate transporter
MAGSAPIATARSADAANPYATGWRMWVPVAVMMTCSCLSYIDRQALAVISPLILKDTGLSVTDYADAISVFSIVYMIANPLWGSLLDYLGLRVGMLAAVGIWTFASASHAWVAGFYGFAVARGLLGFGEGATFPGGMRTAADSLPPDRRSRGMAISYSGASVGAIVAPLFVIPMAVKFGWRAAFLATGALGVFWLIVWSVVARPPLVRAAERKGKEIEWSRLLEWEFSERVVGNLFQRRFWSLVAGMGLGGAALGPTLALSPLYFSRVFGFSQAHLGGILWIPAVCWEFGYYFWGWVADRFVRDNPRPVRQYLLMTVLALVPSLVTKTHSWIAVLALFSWGMFVAVGFIVTSLHLARRAYPREEAGKVAGIGSGSWSAVVALLMLVYGPWFDRKWYGATFVSLSLIPILGTTLWWWIGRARTSDSAEGTA